MKKEDTDKIVIDITEKWLDIQLDIGKIDRTHLLKVKGSQGNSSILQLSQSGKYVSC